MRIGSVAAAPFVGEQFASLYLGAERVPTVPGKPVIGTASNSGSFFFDNPANDGGSAILSGRFGYKAYISETESGVGTEVEIDAVNTGNGFDKEIDLVEEAPGFFVRVSAINAVGEGPRSDAVQLALYE
jgi:hypothetical protein